MLREPQIFILKTVVTLVILLEIEFVLGINKITEFIVSLFTVVETP
jgi:hypothetical protein